MSSFKEIFDKIETGMVLEIKDKDNEQTSLVMVLPNDRNELAISGPKHWFPLKYLKNDSLSYYSIVLTKVYGRTNNCYAHMLSTEGRKLIWFREEMCWKNIAMDTPIIVKSNNGIDVFIRHFAGYEDGLVYYWANGKTSITVDDAKVDKIPHNPELVELYKEEPHELKAGKIASDISNTARKLL